MKKRQKFLFVSSNTVALLAACLTIPSITFALSARDLAATKESSKVNAEETADRGMGAVLPDMTGRPAESRPDLTGPAPTAAAEDKLGGVSATETKLFNIAHEGNANVKWDNATRNEKTGDITFNDSKGKALATINEGTGRVTFHENTTVKTTNWNPGAKDVVSRTTLKEGQSLVIQTVRGKEGNGEGAQGFLVKTNPGQSHDMGGVKGMLAGNPGGDKGVTGTEQVLRIQTVGTGSNGFAKAEVAAIDGGAMTASLPVKTAVVSADKPAPAITGVGKGEISATGGTRVLSLGNAQNISPGSFMTVTAKINIVTAAGSKVTMPTAQVKITVDAAGQAKMIAGGIPAGAKIESAKFRLGNAVYESKMTNPGQMATTKTQSPAIAQSKALIPPTPAQPDINALANQLHNRN